MPGDACSLGSKMSRSHRCLRKSGEAFANGDLDGGFAIYHDDFVAHLPGRHSLAGDCTGREAYLQLSRSLAERASLTSMERFAYLADDEHGIMLQRVTGARGDTTFEERIVFVMRFRDGKVSEMWVIPFDQAAFDEWMA